MEFHEYANLFPMMSHDDQMRLADDMKEKGQSDPIILFEGKILDGRNRYKACLIQDISPRFEEYTGSDALGFVISHNLHRRHLTESQRGMIASRVATMKNGGNNRKESTSPIGEVVQSTTKKDRAEAAAQLNVGTTTLDRARRVEKHGSPELIKAVEDGAVKLGTAEAIVALSKEEQRDLVAAGTAAVKAKAKELRESTPASELEAAVVDGLTEEKPSRIPKWVPDDADRLWLLAKQDLNKILPTDKSRVKVLNEIISYAQERLESNK